MSSPSAPSSNRSSLDPAAAAFRAGDGSLAALQDPRASSTQSLVSLGDPNDTRRRLLVIYIHGFMGNDSSFRSFPAHVHNFLKRSLSETHVVHTKLYPRYKTYKFINLARDNFSRWLEPHESENTDVILVGHSMGGLLAADVALMPKTDPKSPYPFKHRILGTMSFDSPFLGIHPGVVFSGIASLFRPAAKPPASPGDDDIASLTSAQNSTTTLPLSPALSPDPSICSEPQPSSDAAPPDPSTANRPDPFFNQPFFNDVQFLDRGWWKNMTHFAKKHREEGIIDAAANHILNHLEFGGCLADYASLNIRYNKIRKLENIEPIVWTNEGPRDAGRIRFVNYYTISTGKIRKHKSKGSPYLKPEVASSVSGGSGTSTPRISIEDHSDVMRPQLLEYIMPDEITPLTTNSSDASNPPRSEPPKPSQQAVAPDDKPPRTQSAGELALGLPEIPPLPAEPETPNLDAYTDKDARKQTEKEARRARKAYEQAVKNREKAIKERARIIEKRRKKAEKEAATRASEERKRLRRETLLLRQIDEAAKQGGVGAPSGVPLPQATYKSTTTAASPTTEKESGQQLSRPTSPSPSSSQPDAVTAAKQGSSSQAHDASTTIGALAPPSTKDSSTLSPADAIRPRKDQDGGRKREKELKFCMLPRKVDSKSGGVGTIPGLDPREATVANNPAGDPTWVRVNMAGVDEVGAHCGLFFPGPHYEPLVGDVGERIVSWVQEDASKRAILAMGREAASDASGRD